MNGDTGRGHFQSQWRLVLIHDQKDLKVSFVVPYGKTGQVPLLLSVEPLAGPLGHPVESGSFPR